MSKSNLMLEMSYGGNRNYGGGYRSGGYGGDRFGGPKPVESGKEYDVEITEISRQGDGIARVKGFVIFVKGGKVGQKTRVRIVNVGARFATAEVVSAGAGQEAPKDMAPQTPEAEKPELQDYKGTEQGEKKLE
ncbi:MAG: TRAM domain-containing protein [Nitrososphaera sp.]